jgi:hypothetical protein
MSFAHFSLFFFQLVDNLEVMFVVVLLLLLLRQVLEVVGSVIVFDGEVTPFH